LFKNGESGAAIKEFREAINKDPELGLAYINLGTALSELDQEDEACEILKHGLTLLPNHADGSLILARSLRAKSSFQEAAEYYTKVIELEPNRTELYWELGYSLEQAGDIDGGIEFYNKCLQHHPDNGVAQHLLNALQGHTTEAAPSDYISELFDDYADNFDDSLINDLNYVVPKLFKANLEKHLTSTSIESALDLGIGTGLAAAEIRDYINPEKGIIHGVDLSPKMIETAERNGLCDEGFISEISTFLGNTQLGKPKYHLITSADVFVYIGNLEQIFKGVSQRLDVGGIFLFSIERSADEDYKLLPTGRYAHSKNYVHSLANRFHFQILEIEGIVGRQDAGKDINGYLVCLRKVKDVS